MVVVVEHCFLEQAAEKVSAQVLGTTGGALGVVAVDRTRHHRLSAVSLTLERGL